MARLGPLDPKELLGRVQSHALHRSRLRVSHPIVRASGFMLLAPLRAENVDFRFGCRAELRRRNIRLGQLGAGDPLVVLQALSQLVIRDRYSVLFWRLMQLFDQVNASDVHV